MSVEGFYGVGMRWLALTPRPLSRARERGNQSRALGRPDAAEAALAQIFCPPLKRGEAGRGAQPYKRERTRVAL